MVAGQEINGNTTNVKLHGVMFEIKHNVKCGDGNAILDNYIWHTRRADGSKHGGLEVIARI